MSGISPETASASTAPVRSAATAAGGDGNSSLCSGPSPSEPGRGRDPLTPPPLRRQQPRWTPRIAQAQAQQSQGSTSSLPAGAPAVCSGNHGGTGDNKSTRGAREAPKSFDATKRDIRDSLDVQSDSSFAYAEYPAMDLAHSEAEQPRKKQKWRCCPLKALDQISQATDRILVLLWRALTFRLRYPIMSLIGVLAPVILVVSACTILSHYQDSGVEFVPANMSKEIYMNCNFADYRNMMGDLEKNSSLCNSATNLMAPFGRRYDGLRLMYLPAVLYYGGYMAFVDKSGNDCQQLRQFMEKFVKTVNPYLMDRTSESDLFISFPSEKALDKYRRSSAAERKRPIYAAFVCRAAAPGQLDVTIRMHVRRGTPRSFKNDIVKFLKQHYTPYNSTTYFGGTNFLLQADVVGTAAEGQPYGHLTGGFLDLLTLAHVFNLQRTGVREIHTGSPEFQAQWYRTSQAFFQVFDYFGRIPILDSVAFSSNNPDLLSFFVGEAERHLSEMMALVLCISFSSMQDSSNNVSQAYRHLLPTWLLGPGYGMVRLFTRRAAKDGCDPATSSMQLLQRRFYTRTQRMGVGLVVAAAGPLHNVLRGISGPMRRAYSPVDFLESAMPFAPATVISRQGKPHSCSAPFVVLFVCILWQVVKAIMVDKETGFKNMLKILGISDKILWLSWYLFFILYNVPALSVVAVLSRHFAFTLSDIWFIVALLSLALLASIAFALVVTAVFTDGNLAAMAACAWYILIWVPIVCQRFGSAAWDPRLQWSIMVACPAAALGVGIDIAWIFNEPYVGGIRRSTANFPSLGITLADTYMALGLSTVLFTLLGAYLHKVLPTSNGSPEHPLFFLAPIVSCARRWLCFSCCRPHGSSRHGLPRDPEGIRRAYDDTFSIKSRGSDEDCKLLLDVRGVCKNFRTWRTRKCARGSVQAVKGVSFQVYRDEIFGLLGQNGAGKSTLISVITGSLAATSGDVTIGGVSVRHHPSHARCNIGYCPQFDVLLPYLTIEETLWLYAALRGIPRGRRKEEVAELVMMMRLSEMAKVQVGALSGGWRRRVSSSVAFLGNPTVVFLDEPTAGMDILYRRTFWDSVRGLSKGRCIVLITHMMEEADYLCDRLAIMVDGVIASEGTALALKSRFGSGYIISIIFQKKDEREEQQAKKRLKQLLQTFEYPPAIKEVSRHELRIISPFCHSFQLPLLFSELENRGAIYGVESTVLGFASLEEVFLNVVRIATQRRSPDLQHKKNNRSRGSIRDASNSGNAAVEASLPRPKEPKGSVPSSAAATLPLRNQEGNIPSRSLNETSRKPQPNASITRPQESGKEGSQKEGWTLGSSSSADYASDSTLQTRHSSWLSAYQTSKGSRRGFLWQLVVLRALVTKRLRLLYRDWALVTVSFLIPLILMGLTLYLRGEKSEPRVPISGQQLFEYRLPKSIHSEVPYGGSGWVVEALDQCYSPYMTHQNVSKKAKSNDGMYALLLDEYYGSHPIRFGAYVVPGGQPDISDAANQLEVTIWHNSTLRDTLPLHYSHFLNCIAQQRTGVVDAVFISNQPFEDNDDKALDGIVVAFFTIIAYSFVAAGVGKVCIVERVRKVRHQQILARVTPFQYWISSYIVDIILLILPCSIIFGMILWVDVTPLVGPHQRGAFLLGSLLFCLSVCPLGYAISMGVDSPMTFVIVMLLLGWSLPSIQALFTEVSGLQGMYSKYLRYIFMLLPHAALCELLGNLAVMNQLTGGSVKPAELVNWMEFGKTGCPLLYLGTTILLNWAICIAVDCAINYPMSKARAQATLHKLLHALIRPVTVRVSKICNFCLRRRSRIASSEGLTAVERQGRRCTSLFIAGKMNNRALCLHVKDEEARAAAAVNRLRQRSRVDKFGVSLDHPSSIGDIGDSSPADNNVFSPDAAALSKEESELPLVVYKLEKTYPAPLIKRCLGCCCPQVCLWCRPLCRCCKRAQPTRALKGVSFCVPRGSCFAYIGVNGSGKSTTFNILSSLMCQSGGSVFIGGWDTFVHTKKAREKLHYCPQADALLPTLTGAEHVYLYGFLLGLSGSRLRRFCSDFFDAIGCKKHMHSLVKSYSGGTKRKLSLGIAMLGEVDLLLLDEPTCGVDPESRQVLWRMIEDAKNSQLTGKAVVLTSHSMEECEVLSDRLGIIHRGKMICLGTSAELRSHYGHGYQIECVFEAAAVARDPSLPRRFVSTLQKALPALQVLHRMAYKVTASIVKGDASLATIFREVEAVKAHFAVEAYMVSETTLEEVFVEVSQRADRGAMGA
ncbi:hypothetical protein, conserved [Eimeria necatrix]|uniref:ABC transporter domain-containing protein n=1 Tax=Eimeria necatrix TaxID=51315 RepID=U6MY19_9EIME|nr:hypothetical protein, conserved [Eimeria necatrix]CDJ67414.1 hypothetical protein, conserved [Eimeria necatrix]